MTTVTGHMYLITHDNGTTVNLSLDYAGKDDYKTASHVALLLATLYRCGYVPVQHGDSVIFKLTGPDVRAGGIGKAIDAIGRALGGVAYRFSVEKYQQQSPGDLVSGDIAQVWSERFSFRATGLPMGQQSEISDVDVDDLECG